MAAGALAFKVLAETHKARKDIKAMRGEFRSLKGSAMSAGKGLASVAAGFLSIEAARRAWSEFREVARDLDAIAKSSDRLNIAPSKLQALGFAAEQTGSSADKLEKGIERLTRNISEAADGGGEAAAEFRELGLSAARLESMTADQQFRAVAEAMRGLTSQADKVRIAYELFGRSGVELVNLLSEGEIGIDKLTSQFADLYGELSREDLKRLEDFNDAMNELSTMFDGLKAEIAISIAPGVTQIVDDLKLLMDFYGSDRGTALGAGGNAAKSAALSPFGGLQDVYDVSRSIFGSRWGQENIFGAPRRTEGNNQAEIARMAREGIDPADARAFDRSPTAKVVDSLGKSAGGLLAKFDLSRMAAEKFAESAADAAELIERAKAEAEASRIRNDAMLVRMEADFAKRFAEFDSAENRRSTLAGRAGINSAIDARSAAGVSALRANLRNDPASRAAAQTAAATKQTAKNTRDAVAAINKLTDAANVDVEQTLSIPIV
ncbi:MAG: hypothetical protein AAGJ46_12190 [Planctomycetota bacterium]